MRWPILVGFLYLAVALVMVAKGMPQLGLDIVDQELIPFACLMQLHQGTDHGEPEVAEDHFSLHFGILYLPKHLTCGLFKVLEPYPKPSKFVI